MKYKHNTTGVIINAEQNTTTSDKDHGGLYVAPGHYALSDEQNLPLPESCSEYILKRDYSPVSTERPKLVPSVSETTTL